MLDMKAIIWLENYLQTWQTTLLVVSHDREFLNTVSTDIMHLHAQKLDNYRGNYENFTKTHEEKQKNQQREWDAQMEYRKHVQVRWLPTSGSNIRIVNTLPVKKNNEQSISCFIGTFSMFFFHVFLTGVHRQI